MNTPAQDRNETITAKKATPWAVSIRQNYTNGLTTESVCISKFGFCTRAIGDRLPIRAGTPVVTGTGTSPIRV